jgi:DNA-binding transcriptional LysR family regulator
MPKSPEELTQHQIILARGLNPFPEIKFVKNDSPLTVKVKPRLLVSDNDSAVEAAVGGLGITRLLSYQIAPQLSNETLKIILSEFEPKPVPVHIVHNEGRYTSAKIRSFVDLMAQRLRTDSSLN